MRGTFFLAALLVAFGAGVLFQSVQPVAVPFSQEKPEEVDFALFWEAWNALQATYVRAGDLSATDLIWGAISGMVDAVGDPYTVFMDPEESKVFLDNISGSFEGVGMEIGVRDGQLTVISPLEGTPAQLAGLLPGDKILEIDGEPAADFSLDQAVTKIRGPEGTEVVLSVSREGWKEARDFGIRRGVIEIPSLTWEMREGKIAYIKLFHFSEKAEGDFREAASEILAQGAERIVLDVRNNPGGFLEVAQDIAGWFLESGKVVTVEDFGDGRESKTYEAKGNGRFSSFPVVVLINEGSASASEILAGALQDQRGVWLVGTRSFGKGSVQELERLSDDSTLKVTVAAWLTPKGTVIEGTGLEPDVPVERTLEDIEQGRDPQLDKALELVKNL